MMNGWPAGAKLVLARFSMTLRSFKLAVRVFSSCSYGKRGERGIDVSYRCDVTCDIVIVITVVSLAFSLEGDVRTIGWEWTGGICCWAAFVSLDRCM
jgi:hypothetical protein